MAFFLNRRLESSDNLTACVVDFLIGLFLKISRSLLLGVYIDGKAAAISNFPFFTLLMEVPYSKYAVAEYGRGMPPREPGNPANGPCRTERSTENLCTNGTPAVS